MDTSSRLTRTEEDLCRWITEAYSDHQIAQQMHISYSTVRFHLGNLFRKYNVNSRMQLLAALLRKLPNN